MDTCTPQKPKILLLGISYPDVYGHMEHHKYSDDILCNSELSVDQAVECVRRKILTEMDGRDLARCVATEQAGAIVAGDGSSSSHQVYTASKEVGGVYLKDRHVYANFNNSRGFRKAMLKTFGEVKFQQVILDYYWMPTGWLVTRWNKTLFQETLPDLVKYKLLSFPGARSRKSKSTNNSRNNDSNSSNNDNDNANKTTENDKNVVFDSGGLEEGVVFLPFCAHVCKELVGAINKLKQYYAITFVKKNELPGHILWKGTMNIDGDVMQHRLGKRLDQEEIYCTFNPTDIYQSMEDAHVHKDDVMRMLLSIEDFDNIRMIRLRPLRQHEPPSEFRDTVIEPEEGGFIGLNWVKGREQFKIYRTRRKPPPPKPPTPKKSKIKIKPRRKRKAKIVTPTVESDSESEESIDPDFIDDTDSESSSDEHGDDNNSDDDDDDEMGITKRTTTYYDPCDPDNIPEVTNFYPYPALDINSYIRAKQIVDDDRVMSSWAEIWGPKSGRKKNRKQDIIQKENKKIRKQQKSFLSSNSRLPDPDKEDEEGYKWTMIENEDDGWELTLKGDVPDTGHERKIIGLAKRDNAMTACRQLFEMKNPGFKTHSRVWLNNDPFISCYQIPKKFVLFKREKAAMEAKKLKLKSITTARHNENVSSDDLGVEYEQFSDDEDATKSVLDEEGNYSIDQQLEEVDANQKSVSILAQFADLACTAPVSSVDWRKICMESKGVHDLIVKDDIPCFKPKLITKYLYYDLSSHENFPQELYRLLQDAEEKVIEHIVCWQQRDRSFIVHDQDQFERIVLSECCGEADATYDSFLQNIRNFGFVEIQIGSRKGGYRHELFRRGKPKKLSLVTQDPFVDVRTDEVDESRIDGVVMDNPDSDSLECEYDLSCQKFFIKNLYSLLQDSKKIGLADVISWKENGKSFKVNKPKHFYTSILEKSSSKTSYGNFQKELIDRGFKLSKKWKNSYEHPNFIRGRHSALDIFSRSDESNDNDDDDIIIDESNKQIKTKKRKRRSEPQPVISETKKREKRSEPEPAILSESKPVKLVQKFQRQYNVSRSPNFARELYNLLEDSEEGYAEIIHWLPSGDSFAIPNANIFANKILRRRCIRKSCKTFSSFEDSLIYFGFEKTIGYDTERCNQYRHPHFIRGQIKRLDFVKPVHNNQNVTKSARKKYNNANTNISVTDTSSSTNERVRISSPSSQSETLLQSSETEDLDLLPVISAPPSDSAISTVYDKKSPSAKIRMTVVHDTNNTRRRRRLRQNQSLDEKRSSDRPVERKLFPRRTPRKRTTNTIQPCFQENKVNNGSGGGVPKTTRGLQTRNNKGCHISKSPLDKLISVVTKIPAK